MSEMVERVARAIALDFDIDPDVFIGVHGREKWEAQWHSQARAALAAMREPTEAMTAAAEEEGTVVGCCNITAEPAREAWQAMIDSALTPSPPHQG